MHHVVKDVGTVESVTIISAADIRSQKNNVAWVKKPARLFYITESNEIDNRAISINEAEIFEAFAGYFTNGKRKCFAGWK